MADRTVRLIDQGTFGKVVEAIDMETNKRVAIKSIRAIPEYRDASELEAEVLQKLNERESPNKKSRCILCPLRFQLADMRFSSYIHFLTWFDYRVRMCLVSELLGICVCEVLKGDHTAFFPCQHGQSFVRQLLSGVAYKSRTLFGASLKSRISFDSATFKDEYHYRVVSTRYYPVAEIVVGTLY